MGARRGLGPGFEVEHYARPRWPAGRYFFVAGFVAGVAWPYAVHALARLLF